MIWGMLTIYDVAIDTHSLLVFYQKTASRGKAGPPPAQGSQGSHGSYSDDVCLLEQTQYLAASPRGAM